MASDGRAAPVAITRASDVAGGALAVLAAWLVVSRSPRLAGAAALVSGALLLLGGRMAARGAGGHPERMLDGLLDRAWDGLVLGSIAWAARAARPPLAAAALVALAASSLSSYVRARGTALGYPIEEAIVTRVLRYGLVSVGLVLARPLWPIWLVASIAAWTFLVRSSQVVKEERA
jgi:CDP-diacylglycerol--glycerol-3-phosphate 3-phosphatidyltransferase